MTFYLNLQCIQTCIENTWMCPNSEAFGEILLRVLYNTSVLETHKRNDVANIKAAITESFLMLKKCDDFTIVFQNLNEILDISNAVKFHTEFISAVQELKVNVS